MFDKLNALAQRMDELEARLAEPGLYDDPSRAARLLKERNELIAAELNRLQEKMKITFLTDSIYKK